MAMLSRNSLGFVNERNFAKELDSKEFRNLSNNYQQLLNALFGPINPETQIVCWQSKYNEKADIKIKINNEIKGISIKMGKHNSVHMESYPQFANYLVKLGINTSFLEKLYSFINGTIDNCTYNSNEYKKLRPNEIVEIKKVLNDYYVKTNLLIRFLFQGLEDQKYDADAIIHGTPQNFVWATKSEVLNFLCNYPLDTTLNLKISALSLQCWNRNLHNNERTKFTKKYIQIKWHTIRNDLSLITIQRNRQFIQNSSINN